LGNLDYQDVMAVDYSIAQGYTDPDKLAVGGWYGGILTNMS
jgi:dipeptidyl aminopeptidase/acylaminoacyl peptidase